MKAGIISGSYIMSAIKAKVPHYKPVFPKARGQFRGLLVPTEKEVVVAKLKGAQSGKRIWDFVVIHSTKKLFLEGCGESI